MPATAFHKKTREPAPARDCDAIPPGTCLRCGFQGPHVDALACIDALRDRVATLQLSRPYQRREKREG